MSALSLENVVAENQDGKEAPPRQLIRENTTYRVSTRPEVYALLNKLYRNHTLLSIVPAGRRQEFGSMILEVSPEDHYLVLDEFYPRKDVNFPLLEQKLFVNSQLEGIQISFAATVNAVAEQSGAEYYRIPTPESMYYHQRRAAYRVPISVVRPLAAALATEDNVLLHAELRDLSLGGLCARMTSPAAEGIEVGDEIPRCVIQAPNGKKIVTAIEIVRVEETPRLKNVRVGARFTAISAADRTELSRLVATLDRENIKKIKGQRDD